MRRGAFLMLPFSLGSLFAQETEMNNAGIEAYERGDFEAAEQALGQAMEACGDGGDYCDQVSYNLGNTHYRLGEGAEDEGEKWALWEEAVKNYEQSVELNPEDEQARENLAFVKKKLEELQSGAGSGQSGEEGEQGQEGEQQGESGGQSGEGSEQGQGGEGQSGEEGSESAEEQNGPGDGEVQGESDENSGSEGQQQGPRLGEDVSQQLDEYMREQERVAQEMSEYLNRNPNGQREEVGDPFGSVFADPWVRQFFGGSPFEERRFGGLPEGNEKDW